MAERVMADRVVSRRDFLRAAGAVTLAVAAPLPALAAPAVHRRRGAAPVIERITLLSVPGEFAHPVAMNARDTAVKGKTASVRLARVILSDGTTGVGVVGYRYDDRTPAALRRFLGVDPRGVYRWEEERIRGFAAAYDAPLRDPFVAWLDSALLDALGKLAGQPVWRLFGPAVRGAVGCYDATLYFEDVARRRDARAVGELAARIKGDGYRALKLKLGRPFRWVPGEAGLARDIEAFLAAREAVGTNFQLMADANNGYERHPEWALRLVEACAAQDLYWMEEIFPEAVPAYRQLRQGMAERRCVTRIADGESLYDMDAFAPYLAAGVFDVIQPDLRTAGFTNVVLRAGALAEAHRVQLVPHNWGSELGKVMIIHAARLRADVPFVEDDRYHTFVLDTSGYRFRDGQWHAPEAPGWGVDLVDYERFARQAEELVIR
jgi:L-alanine-DL-glutamate epimerase-like enolase superfamily enzyme